MHSAEPYRKIAQQRSAAPGVVAVGMRPGTARGLSALQVHFAALPSDPGSLHDWVEQLRSDLRS